MCGKGVFFPPNQKSVRLLGSDWFLNRTWYQKQNWLKRGQYKKLVPLKSLTRAETFWKYKAEPAHCLRSASTSKKHIITGRFIAKYSCSRSTLIFPFYCIHLIIFSLFKGNCRSSVFVSTCLRSINTSGEQRGQAAARDDKRILRAAPVITRTVGRSHCWLFSLVAVLAEKGKTWNAAPQRGQPGLSALSTVLLGGWC